MFRSRLVLHMGPLLSAATAPLGGRQLICGVINAESMSHLLLDMFSDPSGGMTQPRSMPVLRRGFRSSAPAWAKTYYDTLGVTRGASDSEIKKAFYKLAKQYHPDTNQDDPTAAKKFQEVQHAYDTLRDPQKRSAYDQLGHAAYESAEAGGGAPGSGGPFGGASAGVHVDPEDLFREFFGSSGGGGSAANFQGTIFEHIFSGGAGGGFGGRARRGRSLQAALTITFEEAVKGTSRVIDPSSIGVRGSHGAPVEIEIPPGVDSGFQLRVDGKGLPGPQGTPPGDLLIQIHVLPSPRFQREGFDLYSEATVGIADAALGTSVEVPTVDGRAEVKVKPGTQPGDKLRMRGYGIPMDLVGQRGRRGDQYVIVKVSVPKILTARQKELLEELRSGKKPSTKGGSSFSGSATSHSGGGGGAASGVEVDSNMDDSKGTSSGVGDEETKQRSNESKESDKKDAGGDKKEKKRGWFF